MITRCPGCSKEIKETEAVCPFCKRELSPSTSSGMRLAPKTAPFLAARKPSPPPEPSPWEEPPEVRALSKPPETPRPGAPFWFPYLYFAAGTFLISWGFGTSPRPMKPPAPPPAVPAPRAGRPAPAAPSPAPERPLPSGKTAERPDQAPFIEEPPPKEWRFSGSFFNLATLEPVGLADIVFTSRLSGQRYPTGTGEDGSFVAVLPPSPEGYDMAFSCPGYSTKFIPDRSPSLKRLPESERRDLAREMDGLLMTKETFRPGRSGRLRRDFAAIPLPKEP